MLWATEDRCFEQTIDKYRYKALLLGIRRDEHGIRAKERYFSPRNKQFEWDYKDQPPELWDQFKNQQHGDSTFVYILLLHWTELDIWMYIQEGDILLVSLYFCKE